MNRNVVEKIASDYSLSGFHCAEAVAAAITEVFHPESAPSICKMATGFGGGIGGSKTEVCGALSGGLVALGSLFGRTDPNESRDYIYKLATEYKQRFHDHFGSTNCRAILDSFGNNDPKPMCRQLTAEAAGILYDLLREYGQEAMV